MSLAHPEPGCPDLEQARVLHGASLMLADFDTPGRVIDEGLLQLQTTMYFVCNKRKKAAFA